MGKRTYLKLLCLMLLLLSVLSGCGKEEDDQLGIDGYVYTACRIEMGGSSPKKFKAMNGYIYYCVRSNDYTKDDLRRFPVDEISGISSTGERASAEQLWMPSGESLLWVSGGLDGYVLDYTVDEEGSLYCLLEERAVGDELVLKPLEGTEGYVEDVEVSYVLAKRLADGSEGYSISLTGRPSSLAWGGNRIYVLMEDSIYVMDDEGKVLNQLSVEEGGGFALTEGEAGAVYCYQEYGSGAVQKIVTAGQSDPPRLERLELPCSSGHFSGSRQGLFYAGGDGLLYRYREEKGSWEAVLRWGDSCLICNSSFVMLPVSEDRMAVILDEYGPSGYTEQVFYILTKTPVEELPEKEVLVMAMAGNDPFRNLEQYVVDFNRSSEDYHVTIQHYDDLTRLDAKLVSSNPPDIINLTHLDYVKYGQKDVLEDLMPYLEASSVLDRAYYRQSLLDVCTVKGRLVCIPDEFICTTVIGRTSQVGSEAGWSVEDAMALAESHPQARLFKGNSFSAMIRHFFQDYILEQYVDWESGECSFDGEEFVAFIKWAAEHSDGVDNEEVLGEIQLGTMPEERLLDIFAGIHGVEDLMRSRVYFGEEVTAVGYPTAGGEASHQGMMINQLGIMAASDKKEGAWQFIESFLSRENGKYNDFPARQDRLEEDIAKKVESEMTIYLPDGSREDFSAITEEEMEKVYAIIDEADFTPRNGIREDIVNIIVEEMSPCLSGAKSYEEAAAIVQNRVKNMVQEESR